jgi:hypothetical protein
VDKFANTLEKFSLCLIHLCNGEIDQCFNGHRLANLCSRLTHLRSIHFAILGQLLIHDLPINHILSDFIQAFRTPFWLDGPFGRIQVCVNYRRLSGFIQMLSLPYTYIDTALSYPIDLIDSLFNTSEEEKKTSDDLSLALRRIWCGMRWLAISLVENQEIPISFLRALQCPYHRGESRIIFFLRYFLCIFILSL